MENRQLPDSCQTPTAVDEHDDDAAPATAAADAVVAIADDGEKNDTANADAQSTTSSNYLSLSTVSSSSSSSSSDTPVPLHSSLHGSAAATKCEAVAISSTLDEQTKSATAAAQSPPPPPPSASFSQLFQFATKLDYLLLGVGGIFALIHGVGFPLLAVVFGSMVNGMYIQCPFLDNTTTIPITTTTFTYELCNIVEFFDLFEICGFTAQMNAQVVKYACIGAGVFAASCVHVTCYLLTCERQMHKLRKNFLFKILRQDLTFFDQHQSGELTTRLADDMERIREGTGDKMAFIIQLLAQFFGGFGIGFYYNWKLTLAVMSLTPLTALSFAVLGRAISSSSSREQQSYGNAGAVAQEVLSAIKIVLAFNGQSKARARYDTKLAEAQSFAVRKAVYVGFGLAGFMLSIFGSFAVGLWIGSVLVENGELQVGSVYTVMFAVMTGAFGIGGLAPHVTAFFAAKASAGSVHAILEREPRIHNSCTGEEEIKSSSTSA